VQIKIPYGNDFLTLDSSNLPIKAILETKFPPNNQSISEESIINKALLRPIRSPRLCDLVSKASKVLIVISDHTRATPSSITLPLLLTEIRQLNPEVKVKIIIATGLHRSPRDEEIINLVGRAIFEHEDIVVHCADSEKDLVYKGLLPSGNELWVNRLLDWAELVVADGLIEPHFFAGFSGGRKSILPGIAGKFSILTNHSYPMIANQSSRNGILEGNIIHRDMCAAAEMVGLKFILNVILNEHKKVVAAFAGHYNQAHIAGCEFMRPFVQKGAIESDIVMTSNGGYPLDQNLYQAVKSIDTAASCVRQGGVIICASECRDGNGGKSFVNWFKTAKTPKEILVEMAKIQPMNTLQDQWQAQILAKAMCKARIIMVSSRKNAEDIRSMGMAYCEDLGSAVSLALSEKPDTDGILVIPDGVNIIVR
jgi:nickel-dependent lactate racemase